MDIKTRRLLNKYNFGQKKEKIYLIDCQLELATENQKLT